MEKKTSFWSKIIRFPIIKKEEKAKGRKVERTPLGGVVSYVVSHDGAKIYYAYYSPKDPEKKKLKRTIVFGSGWMCYPLIWRRQVEAFKDEYHIITLRSRGHFGSELGKSTAKTYIEDSADDLKLILDERNIKKIVLVGHSMWGLIALQFYKKYPHRVAGLVLVSAPDANPLDYFFFKRLAKYQSLITFFVKLAEKSPILEWLKNYYIPRSETLRYLIQVAVTGTLVNQGYLDENEFATIVNKITEVPINVIGIALRAMMDIDLSGILPHIYVPTLVVAGKADPLVLWTSSKRIVEDINFDKREKYAELFLMPKCGHFAMMEHPSKFNAKFEEFLHKIEDRWEEKKKSQKVEEKSVTQRMP